MTRVSKATNPRFWIGSASRDHVMRGVKGSFCQLSHGRPDALRRMCCGDWIAYYSGRDSFEGRAACQRFTAIGKIAGQEVYQASMGKDFHPFRRDVHFFRAQEVDIHPLIPKLSFIKNKKHWGLPFRRGYFEISEPDLRRIATEMLGKEFSPAMRWRKTMGKAK